MAKRAGPRVPEARRAAFENLALAALAGKIDPAGRELLAELLETYPELAAEYESSRELRAALAKGVETARPPADFAASIGRRLRAGAGDSQVSGAGGSRPHGAGVSSPPGTRDSPPPGAGPIPEGDET